MDITSFTNLCRLCLEPDQANVSIFKENENGVTELYDKISVCLPVKLSEDDCLPKNICNTCHKSVDFIYNFWQLSSNSEKQLQSMLGNAKYLKNDNDDQIGVDNTIILYDTLDVKDVIAESKDEAINEGEVEIKEVYFGEYLNQCDSIEDENTVLINEDDSHIEAESETVTNEILSIPVSDAVMAPPSNTEDIQISQIVESSNVSLRENMPTKTCKNENECCERELDDFKNSYSCHLCYKVFIKEEDLNCHLTKMHRCFKCPICQKSFSRAANLRHHVAVHSEFRNVKCELCGSFFKTNHDVKSHMKRMHADPRSIVQLQCNQCEYTTPFSNRLTKHAMKHSGTYLHYCEECGRGFNHTLDLQTHINKHKGLKPYQCEVCGKSFNRESYMKRHRESVHFQPYSFECAYCQKRFSFKYSLKTHIKAHLGIVTYHGCDVCGKQLSTRVSLRNHRRLHFNDKPFKCDLCHKQYATKGELKMHSYNHADEKPFKCDICPKTFRAAFMLKNHQAIHMSSRSLINCSLCDKKYYRKHSLSKHIRKHHSSV